MLKTFLLINNLSLKMLFRKIGDVCKKYSFYLIFILVLFVFMCIAAANITSSILLQTLNTFANIENSDYFNKLLKSIFLFPSLISALLYVIYKYLCLDLNNFYIMLRNNMITRFICNLVFSFQEIVTISLLSSFLTFILYIPSIIMSNLTADFKMLMIINIVIQTIFYYIN